MSHRKRRPPVQGLNTPLTILDRDALDRCGARCVLCERLISAQEAAAAGEIVSTTTGRTAYVHGQCARRASVLGSELLK